jgi:DmsE family decaheme c-type cytochrome
LALTTRLLIAGAFVLGQPVFAAPTPELPIRASSDVFSALQDFVQTQRVASIALAVSPPAETSPEAKPAQGRDPYAVLHAFVRVADSSGTVPLPPQASAPDDAIHAGMGASTESPANAYSVLKAFAQGSDASASSQGSAPDDAIHSRLRSSSMSRGPAPDDAIHSGLRGSTVADAAAPAQTAPADAIHARAASKDSAKDAYSTLSNFAEGKSEAKPIVLAAASSQATKVKKPDAAADTGPVTYVGNQVCLKCHRSQYGNFEQTLHGEIFLHHPRDTQEKEGCESCHGPGSKHAKTKEGDGGEPGDIISFGKDSPRPVAERNAICLSCHERGQRTYWEGSVHQTRDLACTNCHQIMEKVSVKFQLLKSTEPEVCFQCHKDVRAKMVNSSHMPLMNGSIVCSSCHNPHGSATDKLLVEASVNETCYKCHADKRGPFLWEHEPVRENCLNCHNPHGSTNEYMLIQQRPRLCQMCHMGPGHGNPGNPMTVQSINRSCQNCHTFVHGSNSPAGQLFQR